MRSHDTITSNDIIGFTSQSIRFYVPNSRNIKVILVLTHNIPTLKFLLEIGVEDPFRVQ